MGWMAEMQVPQDSSMTPPPAANLRTTTDIADAPQSTDASQPSNPSQPTNPAGSISPAQSHNPPIQPPNLAQSTNLAPPPDSLQESIADTSLNDTPQGTKSTVKSNFKSISKPEGRAAQPKFVASVIITSFLLLIAIFGMQITGLAAAFNGQKASDIKSSWCSPMFALFGVSELDLNCEFRAITGNPHKGIGCIELPGERQQTWLLVTKVFLPLSLAIQGVDFCVLCLTPPDKVWWKINLERPLLTMVCGLGLLVLTLTVGAVDAYRLPEGVTRKIWLVVDVGDPFLCTGFLTPAGLRGQFLAWLDGLLQSWNGVYFGD